VNYIDRALLIIESEFSNNTAESAIDFSNLYAAIRSRACSRPEQPHKRRPVVERALVGEIGRRRTVRHRLRHFFFLEQIECPCGISTLEGFACAPWRNSMNMM
jgi:hypothetical protein